MKKSVKIYSGMLGVFMLLPGLAKFTEPFKTLIEQQLLLINFPFLEMMPTVVKFSEVGVGLALIFLAFYGQKLTTPVRDKIFYASSLAVLVMMIVAVYTHLHPNVPAEILPMEFKPPVLPIVYLILLLVNVWSYRRVGAKK